MSECRPTDSENLERMLKWPLEAKIWMAQKRIKEFYDEFNGQVYISFSGGKDSTVLLHLVRSLYPEVPAVFLNTGLEYPEIKEFTKTFDNVEWLRPKKFFHQIIEEYGWPVVSKQVSQKIYDIRNTKSDYYKEQLLYGTKNPIAKLSEKWKFLIDKPYKISDKCCHYMKKEPSYRYEKKTGRKPFIGTMVYESNQRKQSWMNSGCNVIDSKRPQGRPLSLFTEEDVWQYIKENELEYCELYDKGFKRTGCMFCLFGIQYDDKPNRIQVLQDIHPKLHDYVLNRLGAKEILEDLGVPYEKDDGNFHFKNPS